MLITKSLFVEFTKSPKLARWHANDKKTFSTIQKSIYGGMDGLKIGQSVEDIVKKLYTDKQIHEVDSTNMRSNRHQTYHDRTMEVLGQHTSGVFYQPAFLVDGVFVKCDFFVSNDEGTIDLVEVKAKNTIRRNTKVQPLLDDLVADISIQAWVVKKVLGERFSGKCFLAHTNKEYILQGTINPSELIQIEEVTDELMDDAMIESQLQVMRTDLQLSQSVFTVKYPYDGTDYMTYFGEQPPKNSLWSISRLGARKKAELYHAGITTIEQFGAVQKALIRNSKGETTTAGRCVELRQQGETVVDTQAIYTQQDALEYPLYFYDYETVSSPVPVFEGTHPWQQVVVQYSLHIAYEDGTFQHHEGIIQPGEKTNQRLLEEMITAMNGVGEGTFIVWYKGFENKRNEERAILFPEYQEQLYRINTQTFDLMEVFSKQLYFDRRFEGSCSIKKVLPILTEISYDGLAVGNGAVAMQELSRLHSGELDAEEYKELTENLLEYCKQDTRAMVRIRQELKKKLEE